MSKPRIASFDALKCFAIFCVILGHTIQYYYPNYSYETYKNNFLFSLIYSFHMPLFAIISGMFASSSFDLTPGNFIKKKSINLLLPSFSWAIFGIFISILDNGGSRSIFEIATKHLVFGFWFLKCLFICFVIAYATKRITQTSKILFFSISLFISFVSDQYYVTFLCPFFISGIILSDFITTFREKCNHVIIFSGIFYLLLLINWNSNYLIYCSQPYTLMSFLQNEQYFISRTLIYLYRFLIGLTGSIFIISLFLKIKDCHSIFKTIGKYTIGIYCIQAWVIETILPRFIHFDNVPDILFAVIVAPLFSGITLLLFTFILDRMAKHPLLAKYFLGRQ